MTRIAALICVALAGCQPGAVELAPPAGEIVLATDGLRVGDTGLEIGFGRAPEGAIDAVSRLVGRGPERDQRFESGCREVSWPGLALSFRNQAFVGWRAEPGRFRALSGVGTAAGLPCV